MRGSAPPPISPPILKLNWKAMYWELYMYVPSEHLHVLTGTNSLHGIRATQVF